MRKRDRIIDENYGILVIRNTNNLIKLSLKYFGKPYFQLEVDEKKKLWIIHGEYLRKQRALKN